MAKKTLKEKNDIIIGLLSHPISEIEGEVLDFNALIGQYEEDGFMSVVAMMDYVSIIKDNVGEIENILTLLEN